MQHFPIFVDLRGQRVVVSGAGETAVAKLRLLLKTEARLVVFGVDPHGDVLRWASEGRLQHTERAIELGDATCARLFYAANDDAIEDARAAAIGHAAGVLVNVVDDLQASQFITPAIVDRDPVTVAIGTEGAAPVLARRIKAETEERLPVTLGVLARLGKEFRPHVEALPMGRGRRVFWSAYYDSIGPDALADGGEAAVRAALVDMLAKALGAGSVAEAMRPDAAAARENHLLEIETQVRPGRVALVGAGPGDPELLTLKARRALHEADVVIYDRLVSAEILELARREAVLVEVGKVPGGPSWTQTAINALMVEHAEAGAHVVRLKSGDPAVFGRLDEEMDALDDHKIAFEIIPGITSASAAAADIKVSLTRRRRNASFRLLTGHDINGFAEQDWRGLSEPGAAAAIYMGVRAARFIQGRLMLHGAAPETPVTVVENISRPNQKTVAATLATLPQRIGAAGISGPAVLLLGLAPRTVGQTAQAVQPHDHAILETTDTTQARAVL